jgi:hypothetical protein
MSRAFETPKYNCKDLCSFRSFFVVMACRMGTHPSGPAVVAGTDNVSLQQWLSSHADALGDVPFYFGNDIPFLFKVWL